MSNQSNDPSLALEGWDPVPADELERAGQRFAARARGDMEAEWERWATDCELHSSVAGVLGGHGGVFRGREGLKAFTRELGEAFERFAFDPHEVRRRGRLTLMSGHFGGRGRRSGMEITVPVFWLAQRNDQGKIVWAHAFGDLGEALAAAARREPRD